jgi:phosphoglycerol transferase MdoB-like AlkP superfamily enzyme
VKDALGRELYAQHDKDFLKIASVLFNTFIFAQIFNLINARRINDEYNVFADLHKSHIFLIILGVILLAQVLIINFMGMFFKVQPISWKEWLVTVAIGSGVLVWSFIVRFLSRNTPLFNCGCLAAVLGRYNKVQVKSEAAANAVYNNPNTTLSVQEAVTAVRAGLKAAEEAAAAAEEQKEQAEQEKKKKGSWLGLTKLGAGKGKAKSKEERTLSGRSDSAGSLV